MIKNHHSCCERNPFQQGGPFSLCRTWCFWTQSIMRKPLIRKLQNFLSASGKMLFQVCVKWSNCQWWVWGLTRSWPVWLQIKVWMDEEMIHKWIDIVLIIWRNAKAPTTIPILNLDAYNVHIMGTIVYCIQSFGIEAIHMLTGCTFLYQPVLLKPTNASPDFIRDQMGYRVETMKVR